MEAVTVVVQRVEDIASCPQAAVEGRRGWNHTLHVSADKMGLPFGRMLYHVSPKRLFFPSISADHLHEQSG